MGRQSRFSGCRGVGGNRFTLTGALESTRNWKFWISFSNKAEVVSQRDYFCTTETGMTRSLRMQMQRGLKQEWLKRSSPRKEKAPLLHPTSAEPSLKNRAGKAFFGAELKNAIRTVLLHREALASLISAATDLSPSEQRDMCVS